MNSPCPYICNNKTDYGYCKTSACINSTHRAPTFTSYDPIEIARQYAPKFDKPVVDMVAVVRCRDCKSWNRYDDVQVIGSCNRHGGVYNKRETDFCSWGEQKDGGENG